MGWHPRLRISQLTKEGIRRKGKKNLGRRSFWSQKILCCLGMFAICNETKFSKPSFKKSIHNHNFSRKTATAIAATFVHNFQQYQELRQNHDHNLKLWSYPFRKRSKILANPDAKSQHNFKLWLYPLRKRSKLWHTQMQIILKERKNVKNDTRFAEPSFISMIIEGVVKGQEVNPLGRVDVLVELVFHEAPL